MDSGLFSENKRPRSFLKRGLSITFNLSEVNYTLISTSTPKKLELHQCIDVLALLIIHQALCRCTIELLRASCSMGRTEDRNFSFCRSEGPLTTHPWPSPPAQFSPKICRQVMVVDSILSDFWFILFGCRRLYFVNYFFSQVLGHRA